MGNKHPQTGRLSRDDYFTGEASRSRSWSFQGPSGRRKSATGFRDAPDAPEMRERSSSLSEAGQSHRKPAVRVIPASKSGSVRSGRRRKDGEAEETSKAEDEEGFPVILEHSLGRPKRKGAPPVGTNEDGQIWIRNEDFFESSPRSRHAPERRLTYLSKSEEKPARDSYRVFASDSRPSDKKDVASRKELFKDTSTVSSSVDPTITRLESSPKRYERGKTQTSSQTETDERQNSVDSITPSLKDECDGSEKRIPDSGQTPRAPVTTGEVLTLADPIVSLANQKRVPSSKPPSEDTTSASGQNHSSKSTTAIVTSSFSSLTSAVITPSTFSNHSASSKSQLDAKSSQGPRPSSLGPVSSLTGSIQAVESPSRDWPREKGLDRNSVVLEIGASLVYPSHDVKINALKRHSLDLTRVAGHAGEGWLDELLNQPIIEETSPRSQRKTGPEHAHHRRQVSEPVSIACKMPSLSEKGNSPDCISDVRRLQLLDYHHATLASAPMTSPDYFSLANSTIATTDSGYNTGNSGFSFDQSSAITVAASFNSHTHGFSRPSSFGESNRKRPTSSEGTPTCATAHTAESPPVISHPDKHPTPFSDTHESLSPPASASGHVFSESIQSRTQSPTSPSANDKDKITFSAHTTTSSLATTHLPSTTENCLDNRRPTDLRSRPGQTPAANDGLDDEVKDTEAYSSLVCVGHQETADGRWTNYSTANNLRHAENWETTRERIAEGELESNFSLTHLGQGCNEDSVRNNSPNGNRSRAISQSEGLDNVPFASSAHDNQHTVSLIDGKQATVFSDVSEKQQREQKHSTDRPDTGSGSESGRGENSTFSPDAKRVANEEEWRSKQPNEDTKNMEFRSLGRFADNETTKMIDDCGDYGHSSRGVPKSRGEVHSVKQSRSPSSTRSFDPPPLRLADVRVTSEGDLRTSGLERVGDGDRSRPQRGNPIIPPTSSQRGWGTAGPSSTYSTSTSPQNSRSSARPHETSDTRWAKTRGGRGGKEGEEGGAWWLTNPHDRQARGDVDFRSVWDKRNDPRSLLEDSFRHDYRSAVSTKQGPTVDQRDFSINSSGSNSGVPVSRSAATSIVRDARGERSSLISKPFPRNELAPISERYCVEITNPGYETDSLERDSSVSKLRQVSKSLYGGKLTGPWNLSKKNKASGAGKRASVSSTASSVSKRKTNLNKELSSSEGSIGEVSRRRGAAFQYKDLSLSENSLIDSFDDWTTPGQFEPSEGFAEKVSSIHFQGERSLSQADCSYPLDVAKSYSAGGFLKPSEDLYLPLASPDTSPEKRQMLDSSGSLEMFDTQTREWQEDDLDFELPVRRPRTNSATFVELGTRTRAKIAMGMTSARLRRSYASPVKESYSSRKPHEVADLYAQVHKVKGGQQARSAHNLASLRETYLSNPQSPNKNTSEVISQAHRLLVARAIQSETASGNANLAPTSPPSRSVNHPGAANPSVHRLRHSRSIDIPATSQNRPKYQHSHSIDVSYIYDGDQDVQEPTSHSNQRIKHSLSMDIPRQSFHDHHLSPQRQSYAPYYVENPPLELALGHGRNVPRQRHSLDSSQRYLSQELSSYRGHTNVPPSSFYPHGNVLQSYYPDDMYLRQDDPRLLSSSMPGHNPLMTSLHAPMSRASINLAPLPEEIHQRGDGPCVPSSGPPPQRYRVVPNYRHPASYLAQTRQLPWSHPFHLSQQQKSSSVACMTSAQQHAAAVHGRPEPLFHVQRQWSSQTLSQNPSPGGQGSHPGAHFQEWSADLSSNQWRPGLVPGRRLEASDRAWSYSVTSLLEGNQGQGQMMAPGVTMEDLAMESPKTDLCPACHRPFDSGKKRRLIDSCGHERCYTCLFNSEVCPICVAQTQLRRDAPRPLVDPSGYTSHRPKLKTNGHLTTGMTSRSVDLPHLPPRARSDSASGAVSRPGPPVAAKPKRIPAMTSQLPVGSRDRTSPESNHHSTDSALGSTSVHTLSDDPGSRADVNGKNSPPPPPPDVAQHDLMMRLGLLLGNKQSPDGVTGVGVQGVQGSSPGDAYYSISSLSSNELTPERGLSDTSPMSTLTVSSGSEVGLPVLSLRSQSTHPSSLYPSSVREVNADSVVSLMSTSTSHSVSPQQTAQRPHSITTSMPGAIEELPLFGKRRSSLRQTGRATIGDGKLHFAPIKPPKVHLSPLTFEVPHPEGKPLFVGRSWLFSLLETMLNGEGSHVGGAGNTAGLLNGDTKL